MTLTRWTPLLMAIGICTLSALLLVRTTLGQMALYIHPRYDILLYLCGIVLFFMALVCIIQRHTLPAFALAFVLIPVALGLGVPPRPLDANALGSRLSSLNRVAQRPSTSGAMRIPPDDTTQWNLYDWAIAMSIDTAPLIAKPVSVEGFVVRPPDMPQADATFMLARYVLTCCTADAGGVGMPVAWSTAAQLADNQWVRVTGVVARDAQGQLYIQASAVQRIEVPRTPYLSP